MSLSNKLLFYVQFIKHHRGYVVNLEFDEKFQNDYSKIIFSVNLETSALYSLKYRGGLGKEEVEEEAEEEPREEPEMEPQDEPQEEPEEESEEEPDEKPEEEPADEEPEEDLEE